jgi:hypothetical protein
LVSHGEHLCQSADLIADARSTTERDLRLYHLLGALRSAAAPGADPVAGALGIFARSAQEALAAGVAGRSVEDLVGRLREAGQLLRAFVETDDRMLISRRLLDVAHRLDGLRTAPELLEEPVPIESLGYEPDSEIVPVESLAPEPAIPAPAAGGLETSFRTFHQLVSEQAPTTASLAGLLGGPSTRPAPTPTPSVTEAKESAVAIGTLCYRGHAALERANIVRHQIAAQLTRDPSLESLQPLLQELLDLVPLALAES